VLRHATRYPSQHWLTFPMKTKNPMHKAFTRLTRTIAMVFVLVLTAGYAQAQVSVSMTDVSGRQGETVTVPVVVSGVPASPINSFGFTVNTPAGITFTGVETAGTLSESWGASVSSNNTTGAVGGFGSAVSTNGTLVNLTFTYDNPFAGTGTVTLTGFQTSGNAVNPAVPSFGFTVTDRFMNVGSQSVVINNPFELSVNLEDALVSGDNVNSFSMDISYDPTVMTIDKTKGNGGVVTTSTMTENNWTVALNDVGGANSGTVRVAGFGSTLTGSGTFFKVAFDAVGAGTSTSTISNVSFQPGTPNYGLRTGTTTVTLNQAPVATAGTLTVDEDASGNVTLTGTDGDGDALTFALASQPTNGTVTLAGAVATYTPNANYNGADSFTFTANDGVVTSAAATVSVTVSPVNDKPTANDATAATLENQSVDVTLSGADIDGDALTFVATNGANGTVSVVGSTATYTPNANFSGTDTFTYVANDGTVDSDAATVTVTITQVNSAPVAQGIGAVTNEDTAVAVTFAATDADGDALSYSVATQPANGTVEVSGSTATYTPSANFNGTDTFTYTANDGTVDSAPATVTVTVYAVNDVPVAADATASTTEDTAVEVTLSATDADGDELTYTATDGANGTVSVAGATATYTPAANFNGTDTFTFTANDGTVDSAPATVTVTVGMVNDVPVVADVMLTVDEDMAGELTLSATDNDGDAVTFTVTDPSNGTVVLDGDKVTYMPAANFNGTDSFTYTANDGTADSAVGTVSVTVNAVNDAPVFTVEMPDVMIAEDDGLLSFTYEATDVDGDTLTFSIAGEPAGATFDASTGAFSVDPMGKAGVYTIVGSVSDGTVTVDATAATVSIYGVNMRSASLAGVHEVGPVATPGSGMVWVRLVEDTNTLEVWGTFADLSGNYAASHIHLGLVGRNGGPAVTLTATPDADNRGGSWAVGDNTFDVSDNADLVAAIKDGGAYVNVHTSAFATGEIRGQILSAMNAAPAAATSLAPSLVNVAGDPEASAFSVAWLPVADPDGDRISYLFQTATDENFSSNVDYVDFGQTNGMTYTVADAAELYDALADLDPFSVESGGSQTFYHRVITTDGSLWTAGPGSATALRRGQVTDTETGVELPTEFALKGNYPNPFNPSTNIRFDLPETADVSVVVVDLLGRQVLSVPAETFEAGAGKTIQLDASALSSGIYMYQVRSRTQGGMDVKTGTMTLIK